MKKQFYDINTVGKTYLWAIFLPYILAFCLELVFLMIWQAKGLSIEDLLNNTIFLIAISIISQISFVFIYCHFNEGVAFKKASKINFNLSFLTVIICIMVAILVNLAFSPIVQLSQDFLKWIGFNPSANLPFNLDSPFMLIISLLLLCLFPAIAEELIFRGIILQGLRKYGDKIAIFLTSLLFALIHLSAEQFVFTFLFSLILCYMVIKTGSILSSMIIHFTSNAFSILIGYFNLNLWIDIEYWLFIVLAFVLVIFAFALVYLLAKLIKPIQTRSEEIIEMIDNTGEEVIINNNTSSLKISVAIILVLWIFNFAYNILI